MPAIKTSMLAIAIATGSVAFGLGPTWAQDQPVPPEQGDVSPQEIERAPAVDGPADQADPPEGEPVPEGLPPEEIHVEPGAMDAGPPPGEAPAEADPVADAPDPEGGEPVPDGLPPEEIQVGPEEVERAPAPEAEAADAADAPGGQDALFGSIDLGEAGATVEEATAFFEGLEAQEQEQVRAGCAEVLSPAEPVQDPMETASVVCANLLTGGLVDPADIEEDPAPAQ